MFISTLSFQNTCNRIKKKFGFSRKVSVFISSKYMKNVNQNLLPTDHFERKRISLSTYTDVFFLSPRNALRWGYSNAAVVPCVRGSVHPSVRVRTL